MKHGYPVNLKFVALLFALVLMPLAAGPAVASGDVEDSYHGQMGLGTGLGMLEKWCALPNFSFDDQGGIDGWSDLSKRDCNNCHIGAFWNETKSVPKCNYCHASATSVFGVPTVAACMSCHKKDTSKRGDIFTAEEDVHIAAGFLCQDCHVRVDDGISDHQFLKGTAMDTTEPTMEGTISCTKGCHLEQPHIAGNEKAGKLNQHVEKVACETCHTGLRPGKALASRQWNVFNELGKPITKMRDPGWLPEHKWYDNTGPGASGDYRLPILGYTERRGAPGAKIYPFNAVTVDWFVKKSNSAYDDVIVVPDVKAADADGDGTVTLQEMQSVSEYRKAKLMTADMNFSISHSVVPKELAFDCNDCHGRNGWVLDWKQLGYSRDPQGQGSSGGGKDKRKKGK